MPDIAIRGIDAGALEAYQVLTKRPERMREYLVGRRDWAIPNLWLGVSVEEEADVTAIELTQWLGWT